MLVVAIVLFVVSGVTFGIFTDYSPLDWLAWQRYVGMGFALLAFLAAAALSQEYLLALMLGWFLVALVTVFILRIEHVRIESR